MQSKAMEMLDNLDKNPATGMGKKVSTVHNLVYGTMCTLLSTKSIARGWEPVRDATVTKPNPLTSRLWGSHAAAKNPHPTRTVQVSFVFCFLFFKWSGRVKLWYPAPWVGNTNVPHSAERKGELACVSRFLTYVMASSRMGDHGRTHKGQANEICAREGRRSHLCEPVRMRAVQDPHHKGGGRKIHEIQEMNKISLPLRLSQETA